MCLFDEFLVPTFSLHGEPYDVVRGFRICMLCTPMYHVALYSASTIYLRLALPLAYLTVTRNPSHPLRHQSQQLVGVPRFCSFPLFRWISID